MYQLLMTGYTGWTGTRGTMNRTRVFEHTADYLKERFKPGGVAGILDVAGVRGIPALFAGETYGDQPQFVRLGSITNVTLPGRIPMVRAMTLDVTLATASSAQATNIRISLAGVLG